MNTDMGLLSFFRFFFPSFSFSHTLFSCPSDMNSKKWAGERAAIVLHGNSNGRGCFSYSSLFAGLILGQGGVGRGATCLV